MRRGVSALLVSAALVWPGLPARAASPDGVFGRVDGDFAVAGGLGATFGPRGPRAAADLRARYMQMTGLFVTYEDGPLLGSKAEPERVLATGLEVRPLFLARWLLGGQLGLPLLDLVIDSLALELGASFAQPAGRSFAAKPGLQAGLGLEVPLFAKATGLFVGVHGGGRWSDTALGGGGPDTLGPSDRAGFVLVAIGWQQVLGGPVEARESRRP